MLVRRISPAPRSTPSAAHATTSRPVGVRPPATNTSHPASTCLASIASTTHCAPHRAASSSIRPRRATAAELTLTLSAPASSTAWASRTERMPPPIVNGMKTLSAVRRAGPANVGGSSCGAGVWESRHRCALLVGRGDVEEHELVGALGVVALGELDRVAGVADVDEVRPLHDPAGVDAEARDHALEVHAARLVASCRPPAAGATAPARRPAPGCGSYTLG